MPARGPEPNHELFRYLAAPEILTLRSNLRKLEVPAGDIIVGQGEMTTTLFVIEEGEASVVIKADERIIAVNQVSPGQIFGEVALIDGSPRTASVEAKTAVRLLVMEKADFLAMSDHDPVLFSKISLAVLESLCRKFRENLFGPR